MKEIKLEGLGDKNICQSFPGCESKRQISTWKFCRSQ